MTPVPCMGSFTAERRNAADPSSLYASSASADGIEEVQTGNEIRRYASMEDAGTEGRRHAATVGRPERRPAAAARRVGTGETLVAAGMDRARVALASDAGRKDDSYIAR